MKGVRPIRGLLTDGERPVRCQFCGHTWKNELNLGPEEWYMEFVVCKDTAACDRREAAFWADIEKYQPESVGLPPRV